MSDNSGRYPKARTDRLLIEDVGAETVVYDVDHLEAHCLSPLAAVVFARADGRTSIARLAELTSARLGKPVDIEQVEAALGQLEERGLMAASRARGMSRRDFAKRTAVTAALSVPLVTTVVTPAAAQGARSCRVGATCTRRSASADCPTFTIPGPNPNECRCNASGNRTGRCVFD